ncbi:MAG: molybdopterin molybdotransferase MoeA [Pseudomonadota bacterium]|nr:MAG: molybdopterin molybdotransferase MoeA [Pseudomonadota bacterium]
MLTLEEAQQALIHAVRRTTRQETVPLDRAVGRFTAKELRARVDNPAFDNSAMDGYAVATADLITKNFVLPLAGESSCGDAPQTLRPGTTMRIFTGAPVPHGADAVVMQEDIKQSREQIVFPRTVQPGQYIRRQGEDFRAGELLYAAGRLLTPFDIALLSSAGVAEVSVYAQARVLVVATGNELISPGKSLAPGQIYESNRLATLLLLRQLGVEAVDGGTVRDDPAALRALLAASTDFDFIITSGGASVGDHDLVKQAFAEIGKIEFWKVRVKPGKPIAFGHVGSRTHFFALPGNPVSSLVTFKLFVEPALIAWHHGTAQRSELPATAANSFRRHAGRTEFLRGRVHVEGRRLMATALTGQGSHMLAALRETTVLIRVEADSQGFAAGDSVLVTPLTLAFS